jgi:RNA polymerase sigma-70 factor, ECF subfamily
MSTRLEDGLRRIDALGDSGELDHYYLFHAARADILRRMCRLDEAAEAYRTALTLATNTIEQEFLRRRLEALERA